MTSRTAKNTFKIFKRFNKAELKLQDELIAKTFPETYIKYLENKDGGGKESYVEAIKKSGMRGSLMD